MQPPLIGHFISPALGALLVYPVPFGIGSSYREWVDTLEAYV